MIRLAILWLWLSFSLPPRALALIWEAGSLGGLMQQPASQYWHYAVGSYAGVRSDGQWLFLRLSYLERPVFKAQGYRDGEAGGFFHLGTQAVFSGLPPLMVAIGYGSMQGYLQNLESHTRRSYRLKGVSAQAEWELNWGRLSTALIHQVFVAKDGERQFQAYVVWPFNFVMLRLGLKL